LSKIKILSSANNNVIIGMIIFAAKMIKKRKT